MRGMIWALYWIHSRPSMNTSSRIQRDDCRWLIGQRPPPQYPKQQHTRQRKLWIRKNPNNRITKIVICTFIIVCYIWSSGWDLLFAFACLKMSVCSTTNQCDNESCKNQGDDNMHACCINGVCTCTTNPCGIDPPSQFPEFGSNIMTISLVVIGISILLPILIFMLDGKKKSTDSNDDD